MATKAKIIRKAKKRFNYTAFSAVFFTICALFYLWSMIGQRHINYKLALVSQEKQMEVLELKEKNSVLQSEVNELSSRDRIVSMVEKEGIKTNQDQVIILTGKD